MSDNKKYNLNYSLNNGYGAIPKDIMQNPDIDYKAKLVFAYLCAMTGAGLVLMLKSEQIAMELRLEESVIDKAFKELKKLKLIKEK